MLRRKQEKKIKSMVAIGVLTVIASSIGTFFLLSAAQKTTISIPAEILVPSGFNVEMKKENPVAALNYVVLRGETGDTSGVRNFYISEMSNRGWTFKGENVGGTAYLWPPFYKSENTLIFEKGKTRMLIVTKQAENVIFAHIAYGPEERTPLPKTSPIEEMPGKDLPDVPRYHDSIRKEYWERWGAGFKTIYEIEATYLSVDDIATILNFYLQELRFYGWTTMGDNLDVYRSVWAFKGNAYLLLSVNKSESYDGYNEISIIIQPRAFG